MNKIIFIKKLYNLSFSKYLPGFLRKMMLKKNNITFIPTKLKALPNNNYLTRDTFRLHENLISEYKNSNHISFNSYLDLKKTLREKFNTEAQFNLLDFGGEKIDLFLDITKEFKNIKYFLINQPQINKTLSLIKSKYNYKNLNILNDLSEINKNKYDFVFFGSTI